ncbi:MAG: aldose 1-epimerase family protein [Opitutales bacterium]
MKTRHKLVLMDAGSRESFRVAELNPESPGCGETAAGWSVKSYTLRGGLQEGVDVVEVDNGKLSFLVLPTRGMGIWKGRCGKLSLGWNSPVKDPVNPAFINQQERGGLGWLKGFNEWFVRCGLNSMGPPGTDSVLDNNGNPLDTTLTLHGNIANSPARALTIEITDEGILLQGEVDESMMFGPALRLNTRIFTKFGSGSLIVDDTVSNIGDNPTEHQMLYHINYGPSLLEAGSRMLAPFKQVAPRDPRSAEGIESFDRYGPPEVGFVEQAYYCELIGTGDRRQTMAMLCNAGGDQASVLRYSLDDFPCFTLWKNTAGKADGYVTGLEPATSYPNLRRFERQKNRVLTLAGGESRNTRLVIENLDDKAAVDDVIAEIQKLQKTRKATVHPRPDKRFS